MGAWLRVVISGFLVTLVGSFGTGSRPAFRTAAQRSSFVVWAVDVAEDITSMHTEAQHVWDVYESFIEAARTKIRLTKNQKNVNFEPAISYLMLKEHVMDTPALGGDLVNALEDHKVSFLAKTNLTSVQHDYALRVLTYVGDLCAKQQTPAPLTIAWRKVLESGMSPRENSISTYMYALSLDDSMSNLCGQAATFHDLLFKPNEKTVALRIKSLVGNRDAAGAESLLKTLPKNAFTRLRTYLPILYYYCDEGDLSALLQLYRQMRQEPGVHFDSDTYSILIGTIAENGGFRADSEPIERASSAGFTHAHGPKLFDELAQEMAADVLEINNSSAQVLYNAFLRGFKDVLPELNPILDGDIVRDNSEASVNEVILGRVEVDETSAICPRSLAKLQLFQLDHDSRRHVEKTLLDMTKEQFILFQQKMTEKGKQKTLEQGIDGDYAVQEMKKFVAWLESKDEPYTAIVDGANVGYFGHGTVKYSQVQRIVEKLEAMNERPLVIMPHKYLQPKFYASAGLVQVLQERDLAVIDRLDEEGKLYRVPLKCFDDYYWMIASVVGKSSAAIETNDTDGRFPGLRPMLITNDQMRDHSLELLEPRLFRRWCSCHIVNYDFPEPYDDQWEERPVEFHAADFFSHEIQGNPSSEGNALGSGSLAWHFPVSEWGENERLCVRIL